MTTKIVVAVFLLGLFGTIIYLHGESRYDAGYSKAREEVSTQVANIAKQHAIELAKAIEKTRQQEVAFHAKLSKLQTVKDSTGCLDRALPEEFILRLKELYLGNH